MTNREILELLRKIDLSFHQASGTPPCPSPLDDPSPMSQAMAAIPLVKTQEEFDALMNQVLNDYHPSKKINLPKSFPLLEEEMAKPDTVERGLEIHRLIDLCRQEMKAPPAPSTNQPRPEVSE
jgi:hypothetical protein